MRCQVLKESMCTLPRVVFHRESVKNHSETNDLGAAYSVAHIKRQLWWEQDAWQRDRERGSRDSALHRLKQKMRPRVPVSPFDPFDPLWISIIFESFCHFCDHFSGAVEAVGRGFGTHQKGQCPDAPDAPDAPLRCAAVPLCLSTV